ncbi:diphosphomevalonate decarboxylase [Bacillus sp. REN16]|uniref:diphosphomevalonate decarboxylase n=1 Tax=Bacillus sp. REN16 TaxID=2887296 RepID=UPI001E629B7B|nr:diphosphomevalonate decarboxylase [Bacillus sp. REN16]MCC3357146.1 diphosphomevalonate decarboxylase [Bacillus sp. REN16]
MKATARAFTNIALIKYWGKRDESLFLPMNNSLSITLDKFHTTTSVQFCECLMEDIVILNHSLMDTNEARKITTFLDRLRGSSGKRVHAIVDSINKVPTAAGFASSASGFAALATAATKALDLDVDKKALSQIARQGSGSACRSIYGGYVEWQKGEREDGTDSYASQVLDGKDWYLSILSVTLSSEPKHISSREGMKRTVETSPFYSSWVVEAEKDLQIAKEAIRKRDFEMLGNVVEANALKMHATTLGANPPFLYWQSGTFEVMQEVQSLRQLGIQAYFTIDAGPNVKILCQPDDEQYIRKKMLNLQTVQDVHLCHPGPSVSLI